MVSSGERTSGSRIDKPQRTQISAERPVSDLSLRLSAFSAVNDILHDLSENRQCQKPYLILTS